MLTSSLIFYIKISYVVQKSPNYYKYCIKFLLLVP